MGKTLRIYDLGLKQLSRKDQADVAPHLIVSLHAGGRCIVVGGVQKGVTMTVAKLETDGSMRLIHPR